MSKSKYPPKSEYSKLLLDPRWQRKRLEILNRDEFTCCNCYDTERTLHVHHKWYESGNTPWEYPPEALITLCDVCHKKESLREGKSRKRLLKAMATSGFLSCELDTISERLEAMGICDGVNQHGALCIAFMLRSSECHQLFSDIISGKKK